MSEPVDINQIAARLHQRGVRHLHVLAWRDLDDIDAGGSELHADHVMRRWADAGFRVTARTSEAPGLAQHVERHGYSVVRKGSRYSVFHRGVGRELIRRTDRFDALVEVWNGVPWMSPVWCRRPRITMLHHVHGPMWDQILPKPLAGVGRLVETRLAPPWYRRTAVVTPSDSTRDELLELGFRPDRVTAVPNGVDDCFQPGGARSSRPTVIGVGRMAPVKRFGRLLEAAAIARQRVPNLRLVLVGDGYERPMLERWVAEHGAREWVTLHHRVSQADLVALYQDAWLVASASLAEGWGLTLTEAAACGIPAVATDIRGHQSSVVDGVTGVLAPLDALGDTIADVLLDDQRRDALAVAAQARARTLTWDATATQMLAVLADVVERRKADR